MKLLIVLMLSSTSALADQKNYQVLKEKFAKLPSTYNAKITHGPSSDASDKLDVKDIYKYGFGLSNDLNELKQSWGKFEKEFKEQALFVKTLEQGQLLSKSEAEKLLTQLNNIGKQIGDHYQKENDKYNTLSGSLTKKYNSFEMASYLKNLKMPGDCKIEISDVNAKTLTMVVTQEKNGKTISQKGILNFDEKKTHSGYSLYDAKAGRVETKFSDLDFDDNREQTNMSILHFPDGGIQIFSFQTLNKKDHLVKILALGVKFLEKKSDPFINCSSTDDFASRGLGINDMGRDSKRIELRDSNQSTTSKSVINK